MHGVQSVTDLMVRPGIINLDFADVETVMASMGKAMMGTGEAEGEGRSMKATEMAISNPLIDDYTLKGAKGLLVNITGGKDLKLFEVDEVVNKIRSEVEADAEVIIGAITDPSLEGKIRVSIVATALDGQQPETKSVINMVHRIQNRNPGYSDFSNNGSTQSFTFSNSNNSIITHGANALKLEDEVKSENFEASYNTEQEITKSPQSFNEQIDIQNENIKSDISTVEEKIETENTGINSNGLENFQIDEQDTPNLFNSDNLEDSDNTNSPLELDENSEEEDDLEIPAFLRRQKN